MENALHGIIHRRAQWVRDAKPDERLKFDFLQQEALPSGRGTIWATRETVREVQRSESDPAATGGGKKSAGCGFGGRKQFCRTGA